jgi:hypothetical protein
VQWCENQPRNVMVGLTWSEILSVNVFNKLAINFEYYLRQFEVHLEGGRLSLASPAVV